MNGERAKRDRALAQIAGRQHGVVSIRQLRAIGISEDAAAGRVKAGRLHRIHRGVYAVGHRASSHEMRWMAAVLACGTGGGVPNPAAAGPYVADPEGFGGSTMPVLAYWGAALSHRSAAGLWGLLSPGSGPVDVSVGGDGGRARRKGMHVHRSLTLLPAAVTSRSGIPVTTPARTIADLRRVSTGKRRLVMPRELRRAIRQANVYGLPIEEADRRRRERSDLEEDFLALCRRHRLPAPEVNVRVGEYLVDFLWRDRRLVVETDGYIYHRGRAAFEDDRTRDLSLRGLGYDVMHLADSQIEGEPGHIAAVLRARLASFRSTGRETRQTGP
jgi:very-short-patch-repair endonuclease